MIQKKAIASYKKRGKVFFTAFLIFIGTENLLATVLNENTFPRESLTNRMELQNNTESEDSFLTTGFAYKKTDSHDRIIDNVKQSRTIQLKGKVLDTQNRALVGVNVVQKGTTNGTITDIDGNFDLEVSSNAVLVFSYIGYITQEIVENGQSTINVILRENNEILEEVVVVGYGVQKKSDLTGSISSINHNIIESVPATNLSAVLQGQVPGLLSSVAS